MMLHSCFLLSSSAHQNRASWNTTNEREGAQKSSSDPGVKDHQDSLPLPINV